MELVNHPITQILEIIEKNDLSNSLFQLSSYLYNYSANIEIQNVFTIKGSELSIPWFEHQLDILPKEREIAFHSIIKTQTNHTFHIPLIDFNIGYFNASILEIISERLKKQPFLLKYLNVLEGTRLYNSGRSFHGYSSVLLSQNEWKEFTTSLLLLNYTKGNDETNTIIDTRWIAHRLLEGFGSLRLTCNTKDYLKLPSLLMNYKII